jgi:hypothetical protein
MISGTIFTLLPLMLGLFGAQPGVVGQSVSRLVVQDEVILRVPILPRQRLRLIQWQERDGPKCFATALIQRAVLSGEDRVDFVLAGHGRVRAELDEDCPTLDFYGTAYVQPPDKFLCAGRDVIHSRMGGSCTIQRFRRLIPKLRA